MDFTPQHTSDSYLNACFIDGHSALSKCESLIKALKLQKQKLLETRTDLPLVSVNK